MKSAIALLLLAPMSAWAQSDTTVPPKQYYPFFSTCLDKGYPPDAFAARAQGIAEVDLYVTADGRTRDVVLTKSSGNASLDNRTTACLRAAIYKPAMKSGKPIEVAWHEKIEWIIEEWQGKPFTRVRFDADRADPEGKVNPQPVGKPHECSGYAPIDAVKQNLQGITTVAFTITPQGTTKDVHVRKSSGAKILDDAAITCAQEWLYKPATKNGEPVATPWLAEVKWTMH